MGKYFEEDKLSLILRNPYIKKLKNFDLYKEDSRFLKVSDLPLETFIELNDADVITISESNIFERCNTGDFQKGTIRNYISDEDQTNRHLLIRDPLYIAIQNLRDELFNSITQYFHKNNISWTAPSILTKATEACEDISGLFWTNYKNKTTNMDEELALSQTAQLHLEAMCAAYGNIYSIAPSFRHELGFPSIKHLLEYWHVETELIDTNMNDLMILSEDLIKSALMQGFEKCKEELTVIKKILKLENDYFVNIQKPFLKITYDEAIDLLIKEKHHQNGKLISWGDDFDSKAEALISVNEPVFVYNWPDKLKAFYFTRFEENGKTYAKSFDLIGFHHGEILGGGEREHRMKDFKLLLDRQVEIIKAHGHDPKDYKYYEDLRSIGSIPHSGFGMGFERALAFMYNLNDIRMASLFPRDQKRIYP